MYIIYLLKKHKSAYQSLCINEKINVKAEVQSINLKNAWQFGGFVFSHSLSNALIEKMKK